MYVVIALWSPHHRDGAPVSKQVGNRCGGRAPPYPRLSLIRRIVVPRLGGLEKASPHPLENQNTVGVAALATPLGACGHDPLADTSALGSPEVARVLTEISRNFLDAHEASSSSALIPCGLHGGPRTPIAEEGARHNVPLTAYCPGGGLDTHERPWTSTHVTHYCRGWASLDAQLFDLSLALAR